MKIMTNLDFCTYLLDEEKEGGELNKTDENIGIWGQWHAQFLKSEYSKQYYELLQSGEMHDYLQQLDTKASAAYQKLLKSYIKERKINKTMKKNDLGRWFFEMDKAIRDAQNDIHDKYILNMQKGVSNGKRN